MHGELYDLPWRTLRDFLLPSEPVELELGVIELEDGDGSLAMVRRRAFAEPETFLDISAVRGPGARTTARALTSALKIAALWLIR